MNFKGRTNRFWSFDRMVENLPLTLYFGILMMGGFCLVSEQLFLGFLVISIGFLVIAFLLRRQIRLINKSEPSKPPFRIEYGKRFALAFIFNIISIILLISTSWPGIEVTSEVAVILWGFALIIGLYAFDNVILSIKRPS
jgi:hypothetical protein